jgi:hypothetical protein
MWPEDAEAKHKGRDPSPIKDKRLGPPVLLPDRLQVLINRFYLPEQGLPCGYPLLSVR